MQAKLGEGTGEDAVDVMGKRFVRQSTAMQAAVGGQALGLDRGPPTGRWHRAATGRGRLGGESPAGSPASERPHSRAILCRTWANEAGKVLTDLEIVMGAVGVWQEVEFDIGYGLVTHGGEGLRTTCGDVSLAGPDSRGVQLSRRTKVDEWVARASRANAPCRATACTTESPSTVTWADDDSSFLRWTGRKIFRPAVFDFLEPGVLSFSVGAAGATIFPTSDVDAARLFDLLTWFALRHAQRP